MEINVGDKFQSAGGRNSLWTSNTPPVYTVTKVEGDIIHWDCEGRKEWIRMIDKATLEKLLEKELIKIN